jgi:hypothetical protein
MARLDVFKEKIHSQQILKRPWKMGLGVLVTLLSVGTYFAFYQKGKSNLPSLGSAVTSTKTPEAREDSSESSVEGTKDYRTLPTPVHKTTSQASQDSRFFQDYRHFSAPTLLQYRNEVSSNPHETPPSLQSLAREVARAMERSKLNPEVSSQMAQDLDDCAQNSSLPPVARTFCAETSDDLKKRAP